MAGNVRRVVDLSTAELEVLIARDDLWVGNRTAAEEELTRRLTEDLLTGVGMRPAPTVGTDVPAAVPSRRKSNPEPVADPAPSPAARRTDGRGVKAAVAAVAVVLLLVGAKALDATQGSTPAGSPSATSSTTASWVTSTSSSPSAESADAWLTRMNAYCRGVVDPELKAVPTDDSSPASYRTEAEINRQLAHELRSAPPSALTSDVVRLAGDWESYAGWWEQAATALGRHDGTDVHDYRVLGAAENDAGNSLARQLGLDDCAGAGGL